MIQQVWVFTQKKWNQDLKERSAALRSLQH